MDDEQRRHLERLRKKHVRRLNALEEQAARTGINTSPEIIIEIEDLRRKIAALDEQLKLPPAIADVQPPLPAPRREQRKLVTALRAQINGLAALTDELDPEDVAEVLAALRERVGPLMARFGGQSTLLADGHMAAFWGTEIAHEDDPEQAVRAALAAQAELQAFSAEHSCTLAITIGISTGVVLIGGSDGPVGDAVIDADQLALATPIGGLLITHETYRHVRGLFDVELYDVRAVGKAEAPHIYLVKQAKPRPFPLATRSFEGIETRMIGRDAELKRVQDALHATTEDSERQMITIVAEAGLGKSRLLYEFLAWLELQPVSVLLLAGRAVPGSHSQPFALLRSAFAQACQIQDSDSALTVREKLEHGLGRAFGHDTQANRRAQIIGSMLGFTIGESPLLQGIATDPKQIRDRGAIELAEYFRLRTQEAPVVMLIEDLHWADDASLDTIATLLEVLKGVPLLILGVARPELYEQRPHWGEGQRFHTRIDLHPLSARDNRRLVEEILRRVENIPTELRDLLITSAEGNPFYVEELVKMLIDIGAIRTDEERWAVDTARLALTHVPPTLTGVLQARLDSLPVPEQVILECAAVIGRIFWDETIAYLDAPNTKEAALTTGLQTLRRRELIYQRERSAFATAQEFMFKHALLRDVSYERVIKPVRRTYHAQAASWLEYVTEQASRADEYAMLIAQHYDQADEKYKHKAATWYGRAGRYAAARFANAEAITALSRALVLTPEEEETARYTLLLDRERVYDLRGERVAQAADLALLEELAARIDVSHQAMVSARWTNYAVVTGDYHKAGVAAEQAIAQALRAGAQSIAALAYVRWARALRMQGHIATAEARALDGLRLARAASARGIEMSALNMLGVIARVQGDYRAARAAFEQMLQMARMIGAQLGENVALLNLGSVALAQGNYSAAHAMFGQGLQIARVIGDRTNEGEALLDIGRVALAQGDHSAAHALFEQSLQIMRMIGDRAYEGEALLALGRVALAEGDYSAARTILEQSLHIMRPIGDSTNESSVLLNLGRIALAQGDHSAAHALFEQSLQVARAINDRESEVDALSVLGDALAGFEHHEEAITAYTQAQNLAQELGLLHLKTEPQAGLARVLLAQGNTAEALAYVVSILDYLVAGGTLNGIMEPFRIELICYQVLHAVGDPRAKEVLERAYERLSQQAAKITDETTRRMFLEHVPWHHDLIAAWKAENPA